MFGKPYEVVGVLTGRPPPEVVVISAPSPNCKKFIQDTLRVSVPFTVLKFTVLSVPSELVVTCFKVPRSYYWTCKPFGGA